MAQRVKHLPAMHETQVQFLGREDPLQKEIATHSSTLAWKIPWTEKPGRLTVHGVAKSRTRLSDFTFFLSIAALSTAICSANKGVVISIKCSRAVKEIKNSAKVKKAHED